MTPIETRFRCAPRTRPVGLLGGLALLLGACGQPGEPPAVDSDEPTSLRSALITRVSGAKMFCWDGL